MYMDLSLGTLVEATQAVHEEEHQEEEQCQEPEDHLYQQRQVLGRDRQHGDGDGDGERSGAVERREHMFDKVLTPSDVGKLNRLVVPKQHAERFFPAAGAGTQLCFEDRASVPWRFRYSYWGSSQSYVMTKGWSRFVRAARLAAGDTVSFSRAACGRYFIDYRHCQRRRQDINFGDAAATVPAAWPLLDCMQRTTAGGSRGATMTTVDTVPVAGHHVEVEPTGTRCFRLFGVDVECGGDDLAAEEEYADGDSQSP